jgi:endonuclease/exonuclease/phosphatase (EEP) superfamily protein YafD
VFLHESSLPWEEAMIESDLGYRVEKTRDDDLIFGTLVLVRPGAEIRSFGFTTLEPRSVEVHLTTFEGTPVSILAVHPVSPVSERNASLRDAQLRFAANWANDQEGATVIVGDFNAGPWSHAFRELVADTGLRNSQRGFGLQPTFPTSSNVVFRVPIDHLLASPELSVVDRRLGPPLGSDHFPLIVDLAIG